MSPTNQTSAESQQPTPPSEAKQDAQSEKECIQCGDSVSHSRHVDGYCYAGGEVNKWLPCSSTPTPERTAEEEQIWAILYDEPERKPMVFMGHGAEEAAHETLEIERMNWTCHLLTNARSSRASVLKEAQLAYESHTHKPTEFGGDTCSICGNDIRNMIHLRVGETRKSRIESLTKEQA